MIASGNCTRWTIRTIVAQSLKLVQCQDSPATFLKLVGYMSFVETSGGGRDESSLIFRLRSSRKPNQPTRRAYRVGFFACFSCDDAVELRRQASCSNADMRAARAVDFQSHPHALCGQSHAVSLMMIIVADVLFTYQNAQHMLDVSRHTLCCE